MTDHRRLRELCEPRSGIASAADIAEMRSLGRKLLDELEEADADQHHICGIVAECGKHVTQCPSDGVRKMQHELIEGRRTIEHAKRMLVEPAHDRDAHTAVTETALRDLAAMRAERDALLDDLDRQQRDLDAARADAANTNRLYVDELANAERLRADVERLTAERDSATQLAESRAQWSSEWYAETAKIREERDFAVTRLRDAEAELARWQALGDRHDIQPRPPGCRCHQEPGDSDCPVHPNDDTADKEPHE